MAQASKKKLFRLIGILLVLAALGGIAYSFYFVNKQGTDNVVTCTEDGKCYFTAHWHLYIIPQVCGEEKTFETEKAPLGVSHTHEERNIFHWHDKLEYDNVKKEPLDKTPLSLGIAFDNIGVTFDQDKFYDKKNGDVCPGETEPGKVKMLVNGEPNTEYRDYIWKDRDVVVVVFDARTTEEVQAEYKANPRAFPALGRG